MNGDNVTPISNATKREQRRQHARSRMAGRLFAIFDLMCGTAREARDSGEELNDAALKNLGGKNDPGEGGELYDAMRSICRASCDMLRAAQPDEYPDDKDIGERP